MRERRRIAFKRHRVSFLALLLIVSLSAAAFSSGLFVQPKNVEADASTVIFLTSGTSWTVPADWNNSNNSIEVIGGGGGGGGAGGVCCTASDWYAGTGGGGSAYSKATNVTLTPNGSVGYQIGSQGVGGTGNVNGSAGGDTYFCNSTSNCTSISGTAVVAGAKGGLGGVSTRISAFASGGAGGSAASGLGSVKFSGGKGGDGVITPYYHFSGSGAGGAGGPHGNGAAGHDANNGPGTGGGGADGGSAGESGCYSCDYEPFAYGGAGGNNRLGSGYSDSNPWMLYAFPASDNHFCMGRNGVNQPFCMTDFNAV